MHGAHLPTIVFGGSGAVGRFLLRRLVGDGVEVIAASRDAAPAWAGAWRGLRWQRGGFDAVTLPGVACTLYSAGPLDAFVDWLQQAPLREGSSVVALSSMSLVWKRQSPNPGEAALAARLFRAEQALAARCGQAQCRFTILRPTLIWGAGIDRSLTPLVRFARRWHGLPWPRFARGRRQPVHADDVAAAMQAAASAPIDDALALPGADCFGYDMLIDRLLAGAAPGSRRIGVPLPLAPWRRLAALDTRLGAFAAVLARSAEDQLADTDDWRRLGIRPRGFAPGEDDFRPWSQPAAHTG